MGVLTQFFNLFKPAKTDPAAIERINGNMDIIDTEMHRPPLTVNKIQPNPLTRDLEVTTVPLADNLTSDEAQINEGTYILRTSGGEASIADGSAWLNEIIGNMVKTGYVPESIDMTVSGNISATLDRDTFVAYVATSGTITLSYTTDWSADPETYGITVTGTPENGDTIVVVYVKENRGQITTASPSSFVSTGWNLYNHAVGYARVINYSEEYGFMIEGSYSSLKFAETLSGEQVAITPVNGFFVLPAGATSGYIFVTGGNNTDTAIWMTWSDWTEEANGGTWEAYTQTTIDLSEIMVLFPNGLMRVGNVYDEINLNTQRAYSRIDKIEYTAQNLEDVIASGVPYDTDTGYIYFAKESPAMYTINVDGEYAVSDHGMEMFLGTSVPVTASSLYGQDLNGKLRRDVVTISQQTLTAAQQAQARVNIGAAAQEAFAKIGTYPPAVNGQYTTAAWTSGSWSSGGVWSAPEDGIYLAYMWIQLNSEYSVVAYRKYYRQLQMQGTCTRLLQNPLYYDTGVTEDSAFEGRCITQPIYAKAGQTLYPYVHTDAVGCVYDYKIFCIRIA